MSTEMEYDVNNINPLWEDNLIQFARLLSEIESTQDTLDWDALCRSMDLDLADVYMLFDRAHEVWELAKNNN